MWALGTTVYNIAYKYAGTISQAAVQVANVVQNLFVVLVWALEHLVVFL